MGPHEAYQNIVDSRVASDHDRQCASVLMKHVNRQKRRRDNQRQEIERLKALNEKLKLEVNLLKHLIEEAENER